MWREREYKYLPQYLDETYKQNYIWKIPNRKRRLMWFMCMWEDDTKSVLQKMRTVVGDLNSYGDNIKKHSQNMWHAWE